MFVASQPGGRIHAGSEENHSVWLCVNYQLCVLSLTKELNAKKKTSVNVAVLRSVRLQNGEATPQH